METMNTPATADQPLNPAANDNCGSSTVTIVKPPRRTRLVGVRFTNAEFAQVQRQAEAAKVDLSTFARAVLLNEAIPTQARKATPDEKELARMLAHLGKIGSNANQIARMSNTTGDPAHPEVIRQLAEAITGLRETLREALSR